MARIVKSGSKNWQIYGGTCKQCGCVIEASIVEVEDKNWSTAFGLYQGYVKCPQCEDRILCCQIAGK